MRYDKEKTKYINDKINTLIEIYDLEVVKKGFNKVNERIEVQKIKNEINLYDINIYNLDFVFRVYYSNGGNGYRYYISSELYNHLINFATDYDNIEKLTI